MPRPTPDKKEKPQFILTANPRPITRRKKAKLYGNVCIFLYRLSRPLVLIYYPTALRKNLHQMPISVLKIFFLSYFWGS